MKKVIKTIALATLVAFSTAATVSSAVAWFTYRASIADDNINGSAQGAYFAGGDGTEDNPFLLTNKYHVYNLAWLTYIGYFDDPTIDVPHQSYFQVVNDIDMEGLYVPPIGTSIHPFIGNFDGNEKVIYNFGISNQIGTGSISKKPSTVGSTLSNVNIVGFFGVVGLLPSNSDASYSSLVNAIYDLALDDFTIQTGATSGGNLVGLAAGYVNADVSNVMIGDSKFDIASNTQLLSTAVEGSTTPQYLSYYSTVGYCTTSHRQSTSVVDITAELPNVKSGAAIDTGNVFGASIPMKNIYDHLLTVKGAYGSQLHKYQYVSSADEYYNSTSDATPVRTEEVYTDAPNYRYNNTNYSFSGPTEEDPSSNEISSFNFTNRTDRDDYIYLDGRRTLTINNGTTHNKYTKNGYYIYDGTHYLGLNGTTITDVAQANATLWTYQNNYLQTRIGNTTYYLNSSNAGVLSLSTSTTGRTSWSISGTAFRCTYGNIIYRGNSWVASTSTSDTFYVIYDGTHYLGLNGTTITDVAQANATKWSYATNYLSTTINGTTYYLNSNNTGTLSLSNSTNSRTTWTLSNNQFTNNNYGTIHYNSNDSKWMSGTDLNGSNSYYRIHQGSDYLNANGTTLNVGTSTSTTRWYFNGNGYIYTIINNTNYYLYYNSNNTDNRQVVLNTGTGRPFIRDGSNRIVRSSGTARYVYKNGTNWYARNNQTASTFTFDETVEAYDYRNVTSSSSVVTYNSQMTNDFSNIPYSTTTTNATYTTNDTYFPLKYTDDYSDVSYTNTGYIVSGSNYMANSTVTGSNSQGFPGDIRVSKYAMSNLSVAQNSTTSAYNSSRFEIITKTAWSTANDTAHNGYVRIEDGFNKNNNSVSSSISNYNKYPTKTLGLSKYTTARDYFHTSLTNSGSNVYGLHFMDAQISKNNLVTAGKIMMNGWEYMPNGDVTHYVVQTDPSTGIPIDSEGNPTNDTSKYVYIRKDEDSKNIGHAFQLPQDCIDFTLSDNGTINFFAGAYFPGNTTFFSLHRIIRDANENITAIKEIKKVFNNTAYHSVTNNTVPRYIFQYTDNSYSVTLAEGTAVLGAELFDTTWITTGISSYIIENMVYYFEIPAVPGEYALGSVASHSGAYLMYLDIGAADESNDTTIVEETITTKTDIYYYPAGVSFASLGSGETHTYQVFADEDIGTVVIPSNTNGNNISFTLANKILTCGPPASGSITQSTYKGDEVVMTTDSVNHTDNIVATPASSSTVVEEITTKWTYSLENEELYRDVTIVRTTGSSSETIVKDQEVELGVTQTDYENRKMKISAGSDDTYVEFYYYIPVGSTVTVESLYTYDKASDEYTYVFIVTSDDRDIVIHITEIMDGCKVAIRSINANGDALEDQIVTPSDIGTSDYYSVTVRGGLLP